MRRPRPSTRRIDFARVNAAALSRLPALLALWLPNGRREGIEYVALNPCRDDRALGSFRINYVKAESGALITRPYMFPDVPSDDAGIAALKNNVIEHQDALVVHYVVRKLEALHRNGF